MNFLERQLEDPVKLAKYKQWFYWGLAAVVLLDGALLLARLVLPKFFHDEHHHFWFDHIPAWHSLYGFISCVAIIVVSKVIGKLWLMRREDYYDS